MMCLRCTFAALAAAALLLAALGSDGCSQMRLDPGATFELPGA